MKKIFIFCLFFGFLTSLSNTTLASDNERTEFEKNFIGKTWRSESLRSYPLSSECKRLGGSVIQQSDNLILDYFICNNGRQLATISEKIGLNSIRLVLDAFLFPKPKKGEQFMSTGDCSIYGDTLIDFDALVRMGDKEAVDWQTGVLQAWIPNITTKRYEPLSIRHIVCGLPTPP